MITTQHKMKNKFNPLFARVNFRRGQPHWRWLFLLTGALALLILAKIVLAASQICDILNTAYSAGLT